MLGVVSDDSKNKMLDNELSSPPFTSLTMGLFTNDYTPTHASHIGDLTELAVAGYVQQTVTGWSAAALSGDFHAVASAGAVTFLNTSGSDSPTIYGWFYYDTTANKLVCAGRFDLPFVLPATVGTVTLTPFFRKTGE